MDRSKVADELAEEALESQLPVQDQNKDGHICSTVGSPRPPMALHFPLEEGSSYPNFLEPLECGLHKRVNLLSC